MHRGRAQWLSEIGKKKRKCDVHGNWIAERFVNVALALLSEVIRVQTYEEPLGESQHIEKFVEEETGHEPLSNTGFTS